MNSPESVFRTIKCSDVETHVSDAIRDYAFGTYWSVVIAREVVMANTLEEHESIARDALGFFTDDRDESIHSCELTVVPMRLVGANTFDVFAIEANIWGLGRNDVESRMAFREALWELGSFFETESRLRRDELRLGRLTVGDLALAAS